MHLLATRDLTKIYHRTAVVDHLHLQFRSGEITALLGRNGAGKTTTFLMMAGIVRPDAGEVTLDGEVINEIPSYRRSAKGLVYLPQQHSVFMKTTVFMNLYLILEMHHPEREARRRTQELLEDFGLDSLHEAMAHSLSGGEKRRLELARAMISRPKFLFLDEPFSGIDPITILEIQKIVQQLRERGVGIIITDHNVKDTFFITDLAYIIHKGRILTQGRPADVVKEEQTRRVFLGEEFEWHE